MDLSTPPEADVSSTANVSTDEPAEQIDASVSDAGYLASGGETEVYDSTTDSASMFDTTNDNSTSETNTTDVINDVVDTVPDDYIADTSPSEAVVDDLPASQAEQDPAVYADSSEIDLPAEGFSITDETPPSDPLELDDNGSSASVPDEAPAEVNHTGSSDTGTTISGP